MSHYGKKFTLLSAAGLLFCSVLAQQTPDPDRPANPPVLLRNEVDRPEPVQRDPAAAEKEIQIGDFYFKRDNFRAAVGRYREAVLSRPDYAPAYEKLIRALEKNKEGEAAYQYMREYVEKFPNSPKSAEFNRSLQKAAPPKSSGTPGDPSGTP